MSESAPARHWLDDPPTVAAVLVTHNGMSWLPKVLQSFATMYHAPDVWRAVDVHSVDGSRALVQEAFGEDRVLLAPRRTGFGDAVRMAVDSMPRTDWIWLLHDDATVLPGTLSGLLDEATLSDDIAAVGPKIREWPSLRRLVEVGVTVTRTGTRETGLESGEPDAGQHDRPRDVLAVNTAGMLIRRDVWDLLDGLDPDLPLFYDDIDFGWRVKKAGYRIRTAPAGVIFHVEAGYRSVRPLVRGDLPSWERRRAALWTQLANAGRPSFAWQYLRLFIGTLLRCLGLLAVKDPEAAGDELMALRAVYLRPIRLFRARRARRRTSKFGTRAVRPLLAPLWLPYRHAYDTVREAAVAIIRPEEVATTGRRSNIIGSSTTDDSDAELDEGTPSWWRQRPWFAVASVISVMALIASRGLWGGFLHGLQGGALPRSPGSADGWWALVMGAERAHGLVDSIQPVFAIPVAVLSTPFWTRPDVIVTVVMVFGVPMAALAAHRLGRLITPHRRSRILWVVGYASLVAGVGATAQGRLGTVVALIIVPIAVNTAWQLANEPHWRVALRLGIAIAVAAAFAPVALVVAVGGLALLWYLEGRWVSRHLILVAGTTAALLGPWLIARAVFPWRWWWEAGYATPGGAESVLDIVMGRAGGIQAPWWLSVPILLLGLAALIPRATRYSVRACWLFGLWCLGIAVVGHLTLFAGPSGRIDLAPWVGIPAVLWLASLGTAALIAVPHLLEKAGSGAVAGVVALALIAPIGVGAWWVGRGIADPLEDGRTSLLVPAFLAERPGSTLILTVDSAGSVHHRMVAGRGGFLGQEAFAPSASELEGVTSSVQHLLGGASSGDVDALAKAGVAAIYVPDAVANADVARRIDAAPGIEPTGSDSPDSRAWVLIEDPVLKTTAVPLWRQLTGWLQLVLWGAAVVLTAPVRRREVQVQADEDLLAATADGAASAVVRLPQDAQGVRQ